jgi:superoxide dismutase, Cu-Zn family
MRAKSLFTIAAGALILAACGRDEEPGTGTLDDAPSVPLVNASGEIIGSVRGGDSDEGATLLIDAHSLPPGERALHIHAIGICEPPSFESAGPHWNPTHRQHGGLNPEGPHLGDLENVVVGQDGRLQVQIVVPGVFLRNAGRDVRPGAPQILDASGAALVIHANADDYRTDPTGNSGERIACAVLGDPQPGAVVRPEGEATNQVGTNDAAPADGDEAADAGTNRIIVGTDMSPMMNRQ